MERLTTVILGRERAVWSCDTPWSDALVAALSADPETLDELAAAAARFGAPREVCATWRQSSRDEAGQREAWPLPLRWLDLPARIAAGAPDEAEPSPVGLVLDPRSGHEEFYVSYTLSNRWLMTQDLARARRAAAARMEERLPYLIEHRTVLYGSPLLDFLLEQAMAVADGAPPDWSLLDRETSSVPSGQVGRNIVAALHAQWLTTSRSDLVGRTPRQIIVEACEHLEADLADREHQWSRQGQPPAALETNSWAYRCGGFSTAEAVLYFGLVRNLAQQAWELASSNAGVHRHDERLHALEILEQTKGQWLNAPQHNDEDAPAEMIDQQRRRLPLIVRNEAMLLDCACPICRELADSPVPGFLHFDGFMPDNDFVFSVCETRDQWESDFGPWVDQEREDTRQRAAQERN